MSGVRINEMQERTAAPITGSLLSSNSQQLVCAGLLPPQQDIFQLNLLQMPDGINPEERVGRSSAEKSWEVRTWSQNPETLQPSPQTPGSVVTLSDYTHTNTHIKVYI